MANKTTKKEFYAMVIEIVKDSTSENKEEILDFLNHELTLLNKKSEKSRSESSQASNLIIMDIIKEVLTDLDKPVTITELVNDSRLRMYSKPVGKDKTEECIMTPQKLTPLMKKLVDSGIVVRTEEKKKAYFSINTGSKND